MLRLPGITVTVTQRSFLRLKMNCNLMDPQNNWFREKGAGVFKVQVRLLGDLKQREIHVYGEPCDQDASQSN